MSGSCDLDEPGSSPSLISCLRNFRFKRNSRPYQANNVNSPVVSSSSSDGGTVIPETPEFVSGSESTPVSPVINGEQSSSPGPRPVGAKVIGNNRYVAVDSSSSALSSQSHTQEQKDHAMDEYELFCEKEQCLREFLKNMPHADIMEAQDILVTSKWDLSTALEIARSRPVNKKKPTPSSSVKGVVFRGAGNDKLSSDSEGDSTFQVSASVQRASQNGTSSRNAPKRRRIVYIDSDDEDDDGSDGGQQDNEVSSVSKPSSNFSVLDYQPPNSNLLLQQSQETPRPVATNSKATPEWTPSNFEEDESRKRLPSQSKVIKKKRKKFDSDDDDCDNEYGNDYVYDSEDSDGSGGLTPARNSVLSFYREANLEELSIVPGCSKKKAELIFNYRPFTSWIDLVEKFGCDKTLSTDLLNGAKKVLDMRLAVNRVMNKCEKIALQMEDLVETLKGNEEDSKDYVSKQPALLNQSMHLTSYQMLGLNWLLLMHNQDVNAILADEMGLGKTIQAIAFLAYLREQDIAGPHLIVVPSSTLDNWKNELKIWWPTSTVQCYHGSQDSRRELRMQIMNDEIDEFDIMVTTYNMVTSSAEDRSFFKKLQFHYVVFDEAHMLKNMASQRYQNLMKVKAARRLLLTGTPLQNNLVELMSLLIFAMPDMFSGKTEQVKQMFSSVCKSEDGKSRFERERIEHAKRIMKPFVLRRLKNEVLKDLPAKHEEVKFCEMSKVQAELYTNLVAVLSEEVKKNKDKDSSLSTSGAGMMMQLRRAANHPLLLRNYYDDRKLVKMANLMLKESSNKEPNVDYIFQDMCAMSDFELHKQCEKYEGLNHFVLEDDKILDSGKFNILDSLLPKMIADGHRILLFSQFTMVLDIVESYMNIREYKFLRLDGQIPVTERQQLIDEFTNNPDIPVFLLSTRAGGLGINLTAADTVLIHDIDFNPYNDKQAEDRSHRVGQLRDVTVMRMISEDTIEEGILQRAREKLKLEQDITSINDDEEKDNVSVATLLRDALGLGHAKS